ncbi:MAG: hypothetical protein JWR61_1637 [Ferruginibacter sp.]|nr:hypothetical protein [Ferruginibacter sp.]
MQTWIKQLIYYTNFFRNNGLVKANKKVLF